MTVLKNKYITGALLILFTALLVVAFLMITDSYFNTKEINLLVTGCYESGGEIILEIQNNLTSNYSFECKQK